jgi:hypothetical protein
VRTLGTVSPAEPFSGPATLRQNFGIRGTPSIIQAISHERAAEHDSLWLAAAPRLAWLGRLRAPGWVDITLRIAATILSWLVPVAFLAWAARLAFLEGYVYEIPNNFLGDFTRTAELGAPTWWTGQGIFYGPIFVLEYKYLFEPRILSAGDFARLDFLLFGLAFACVWLALFGVKHPRLCVFVLAAWLAHHMSIEALANTAHLEVLELALISVSLLLATRSHLLGAGASLGLAIATKTLPALFLPYLIVTRQWRMLATAVVFAAVPFLLVCWIQAISPWDGLYSLIYQGGNLTKLEYSEYEYTPRAEIARMLTGDGGTLTAAQAQLAITLHWVLGISTIILAGLVLLKARIRPSTFGLTFGLIAVVMLVVAPSAHAPYYVFLLPGWTAILAALLSRPLSARTTGLWLALTTGYVFTGFDQPFFLSQRLIGVGLVVPQHWLTWHLPTLGLFLTLVDLAVLSLWPGPREGARTRPDVGFPESAVQADCLFPKLLLGGGHW